MPLYIYILAGELSFLYLCSLFYILWPCLYAYFLFSLRLADVIFLIYVYQRWVYPVDKKRVNEFGFGGEDESQTSASTDVTAVKEEEKKTN